MRLYLAAADDIYGENKLPVPMPATRAFLYQQTRWKSQNVAGASENTATSGNRFEPDNHERLKGPPKAEVPFMLCPTVCYVKITPQVALGLESNNVLPPPLTSQRNTWARLSRLRD